MNALHYYCPVNIGEMNMKTFEVSFSYQGPQERSDRLDRKD